MPYSSTGVSTSAIKMASTRLPSPKSLVGTPTQILAQFPKQHQQSPKQQLHQVQQQTQQQVAQPSPVSHQQQPQQSPLPPGIKPTIQIKQESGNWEMFTRYGYPSLITSSLKTTDKYGFTSIYSFLKHQIFKYIKCILRACCWKYLYREYWSLGIEERKKQLVQQEELFFQWTLRREKKSWGNKPRF